MSVIFTIILTLLVFSFIILIHELGHFLVALWAKVKVNEFSLGMGPSLFSKTKNNIKYSLRAIPMGGYVSMEGEDSSSEDENSFSNKHVFKRILIVLAGAVVNILFGFIVLLIVVSLQKDIASTTISKFTDTSVSVNQGLKVGDEILEIDKTKIYTDNDIIYKLLRSQDGLVDMKVRRDKEILSLNNIQFEQKEDGVTKIDFNVLHTEKNFFSVIKQASLKTISIARLVWLSLFDLFTGVAKISDLSGPIGVASAIGESSRVGIGSFLLMVSFITINVGVFNLLPIPALDGGRLVFLFLEAIRKKPLKKEYESYFHIIGFVLLIGLMIFVTFSDIFKLIF